tara:strand:+ start:269 stop:529 length:261 start_codon:yes stop_codon:yes gene_type:complete
MKIFAVVFKLRLVSIPNSSVEDKVYRLLSEAKDAAEKTGYDTCVEGHNSDGHLVYMRAYSVISGWTNDSLLKVYEEEDNRKEMESE